MLIEHSVPDSSKMIALPESTVVRIWFDEGKRFVTIRLINNNTAVIVEHFQSPGGFSYKTGLHLQPNDYNGIIIK